MVCVQAALLGWAALVLGLISPAYPQDGPARLIPAELLAEHPVALPDPVEFHIVSGYDTEVVDGRSAVSVVVHRSGAAVALVLTSYESILWQLEASPGTRVVAVFVDSNGDRVPHVETALDVPVRQLELPYPRRIEQASFGELLLVLRRELGMDRPASVQLGGEDIPRRVMVPGSPVTGAVPESPQWDPDWPRPTAADPAVRFSLPTAEGAVQEWTLAGPVDGRFDAAEPPQSIAYAPDGRHAYRYEDNTMFVRDLASGEERAVPLTPGVVSVAVAKGVAYDSRRDRVVLISTGRGGTAYLYRFDARTEQWMHPEALGRQLKLHSIAYDSVEDLYVGLGEAYASSREEVIAVLAIPAEGGSEPRILIEADLVGFARVMGRDRRDIIFDAPVWLVPTERGYVFVDGLEKQAVWWMPRGTATAALTYRADAASR